MPIIADDLNPCVHAILCALGDAALAPIKALLSAELAILQGVGAQARLVLDSLEIALAPFTAAEELATAAIDTINGQLAMLPSFEGCIDLGALAEILGSITLDITAPIEAFRKKVEILLAERDRVEAYIAQVEDQIAYMQAVIDAISAC